MDFFIGERGRLPVGEELPNFEPPRDRILEQYAALQPLIKVSATNQDEMHDADKLR
jgi:hypothetical protein